MSLVLVLPIDGSRMIEDPATAAWVLAVVGGSIIFRFVVQRIGIRRGWRQNKMLHSEVVGAIGPDGLTWRHEFGGGTFPWSVLTAYKASKDVLLLYNAPRQFFYLPRTWFASEADWQQTRALASEHLRMKR